MWFWERNGCQNPPTPLDGGVEVEPGGPGCKPRRLVGFRAAELSCGHIFLSLRWVVPASALDQPFHLRTCSPLSATQEHFYSNFHCSLLFILFLYCADHSHEHSRMLLFLPLKKKQTKMHFWLHSPCQLPPHLSSLLYNKTPKLSVLTGSDLSPAILSWAFARLRRLIFTRPAVMSTWPF